jgi:4,4'-diaponeurosporenoate glycosyltransferase
VRIGLLILLVGWVVGWWLLWKVPRLHRAGPVEAGSLADCALIIPARNEAHNLPHLLASIEQQHPRPSQVIVVDDGSDDDTPEVARSFPFVTVVPAGALPEGWTGKAWACSQGASVAQATTLVFVDADVTFGPGGLAAVLATLAERGGLVSVQPHHRIERIDERFSALFNIVGVMGVGMASPGRDGRSSAAFGPCLATSADDYRSIGGHGAVRADIVEDLALARAYREEQIAVHAFGGGDEVSFRMYPGGMAELVEGWSKNFATGAGATSVVRLMLTGMWVTAVLASVQFAIEHVTGRGEFSWLDVALVWLAFSVQIGVMLRQLGRFGVLTAVLYPAPALVFVLVFVRSVWLTLVRRRVSWRGRHVPVGGPRGRRTPVPSPSDASGDPDGDGRSAGDEEAAA